MTKTSWPECYCPIHRKPLTDYADSLVCQEQCFYPRKNGIARFVPDESYTAAFGLQWKKYRRTQLDSYTGLPLSRDRLRHCIGEDLWSTLPEMQVLEAGCGAGRFTELLLEIGACVTSVDLSVAVDANQENCPQSSNHRVLQADILRLPFQPRQFDVVLCLGVIQHTPNPETTIAALFEQVKPGGWLVFDHYTYTLSHFTKIAPLFRAVLRRLHPDKGMKFTERLVDALLPLHRAVRHCHPAQMLLSRFSPLLCYYHAHPGLNDALQRDWAYLDTHDSLTDWYKHFRTRRQIRGTLEELGLCEIWCESPGNGNVEARGRRRPLAQEASGQEESEPKSGIIWDSCSSAAG
jgi:2-polyprenyl-3-methyl-5-hydroxy-6-metoxy-1,4-benzoquinol methylase